MFPRLICRTKHNEKENKALSVKQAVIKPRTDEACKRDWCKTVSGSLRGTRTTSVLLSSSDDVQQLSVLVVEPQFVNSSETPTFDPELSPGPCCGCR